MTLAQEDYADKEDSELLQKIKLQNWSKVQAMLQEDQTLAREPDIYNNLPLHVAIGYKAPDDVILGLLEAYPEATKVHGTDYWLPLHVAAMWGVSAKVMESLILSNPQALEDPGEIGIKGRTPRHFSGRFQHNKEMLERPVEEWMKLLQQKS